MPRKTLTSVARKSPLLAGRVSDLLANMALTRRALTRGHTSAGRHNQLRIPRGVALVRYNGGAYALRGASASISSVTRNGAGDVTLNLAAAYFPDAPVLVIASPMCPGATTPTLVQHDVSLSSATAVRLHVLQGTGWAGADLSFAVELYAEPTVATADPIVIPPLAYGDGLDPTTYNSIAQELADTYAGVIAEHTVNGGHNVREIPRVWDFAEWDGGTGYDSGAPSDAGASYSRVSAGIINVTLPAATYPNTSNPEVQILTQPDTSDGSQWRSTVDEATLTNTGNYLTTFQVHLWRRSSTNTWALADGNFYWRLYTAAT